MADLVLRHLAVHRDGRTIFDDVNATFVGRQRTVLWGVSGSGKSTLLVTMAGLLTPTTGTIALGDEVWWAQEPARDVAPHQRRIGFVFQDLALWPHMTALQHVEVVAHAARRAVDSRTILDQVGLADLWRRRPGQLSGGEQQRLAIARALAGQPHVMLLDEPFSGLDRRARGVLHTLLIEVSRTISGPTIYVTHDAGDAVALGQALLELRDGRLRPAERPWDREE